MLEKNLKRKWQYISFAGIALLSLLAYYPSFSHIPRSDQIFYLAEVAGTEDWFTLAVKNYSLNRTRTMEAGDESTFRPLFYFVLGSEKWLFGYNFTWWQITGFVLHLFVLWRLLKLLLHIRMSIFAPLAAAFFSVMSIGMEAVVWHHINSYLIFTACVLAALYHLLLHGSGEASHKRHVWAMTGYLTAASFIFEAGIFFCLLFALYLRINHPKEPKPRTRWVPLMPLIPVILYAAFSASDFYLRGISSQEASQVFGNFSPGLVVFIVLTSACTVFWWVFSGVAPPVPEIYIMGRLHVPLPRFGDILQVKNLDAPVIAGIALTILCIVILIRSAHMLKARWKFIGLLGFMILSLIFIITSGRVISRGLSYLIYNLYYTYIFWALFIVLIYSLVNFEMLDSRIRLRAAVIALIAVVTFTNGYRSLKTNLALAEEGRCIKLLIDDIESFRGKQKDNPDSSTKMTLDASCNPILPYAKKGSTGEYEATLLELLYRK